MVGAVRVVLVFSGDIYIAGVEEAGIKDRIR